ncbi:hypothetical protein D3C80_1793320 [compost metagenome]
MPAFQRVHARCGLAPFLIAVQALGDGIEQVLFAKWLGQELQRAGLHGFDGHGDVAMGGDEHHRDQDVQARHFLLEVQPTQARHAHIQNQARRHVRPLGVDELTGRAECHACQAHGGQQVLQ